MKPEDQITSRELSQELKELGVPQDGDLVMKLNSDTKRNLEYLRPWLDPDPVAQQQDIIDSINLIIDYLEEL